MLVPWYAMDDTSIGHNDRDGDHVIETDDGNGSASVPTTATSTLTIGSMAGTDHETFADNSHPLSPGQASFISKRSSYFTRPSPSLVSTDRDKGLLFENDDDDEEDDVTSSADDNEEDSDDDDSSIAIRRPPGLGPLRVPIKAKSVSRDKSVSSNSKAAVGSQHSEIAGASHRTIHLPSAPHLLDRDTLRRLLSSDGSSNGTDEIALIQHLSRENAVFARRLERQSAAQARREQALMQLLEAAPTCTITSGMISRALTRASLENELDVNKSDPPLGIKKTWKVTLSDSRASSDPKPLADDLEEAMSEAALTPQVIAESPGPLNGAAHVEPRGSLSPASSEIGRSAGSRKSKSPQGTLGLSAHKHFQDEPDGSRRASTSKLPTMDTPSKPAMSRSPPLSEDASQRKRRTNSILSISSNASSLSQAKSKSSWTSTFWGWRSSSKAGGESDIPDDPGQKAKGAITRQNTIKATPSSRNASSAGSAKPSGSIDLSKSSSSNSMSANGPASTLATSPPSDRGESDFQQQTEPATAKQGLGDAVKNSPVRAFMTRRPSGLHADPAVATSVLPTPVLFSASSQEAGITSTDMLQSLSSTFTRRPGTPVPSHFRAIRDSAMAMGSGESPQIHLEETLFKAPGRVCNEIHSLTLQLLQSFYSQPGVSPGKSSLDVSPVMTRQHSDSPPATSRTKSPHHYSRYKASPAPALVADNTPPATIKLSASDLSKLSLSTPRSGLASPDTPALGESPRQPSDKPSAAPGSGERADEERLAALPQTVPDTAETLPASANEQRPIRPTMQPTLTLHGAFSLFSSSSAMSPAPSSTGHNSRIAPVRNSDGSALQMGTIVSATARPPTLVKTDDVRDPPKDGPLVDRYGFIYDVKVGMKLLRESRRRDLHHDNESIISLDPASPTSDINVESLQEALGPSPNATPSAETASPDLDGEVARSDVASSSHAQSTRARTRRDSKVSDAVEEVTNQSIRRLLAHLGENDETVEKVQKDAWDAFIRKRKRKSAAKSSRDAEGNVNRPRKHVRKQGPLSDSRELDDNAEVEQLSDHLIGVASMGNDKEDSKMFRRLVKNGIPIVYRPAIWAEVSGASELREPGVYQDLLSDNASRYSICLEQIDMDTHRTFPTNAFFGGNGPGVEKLRRVLTAYSWRDPAIGYCQGMNLLAATLLLVFPDEEDAFWMLSSLLEKVLPSDYYSPQLLVSQADQRVLRDLIQRTIPDIYQHIDDLGVDIPAITFGWYLSLFTDVLPIQTLLRVWDVLLVYGPITLFRIALAIFKINAREILASDSASSFYVLVSSLPSHLYSADRLLKVAFEDFKVIKRQDVESLRLRHVAAIAAELSPQARYSTL